MTHRERRISIFIIFHLLLLWNLHGFAMDGEIIKSKNICELYLGDSRISSVEINPNVLVVPSVRIIEVLVPGFGGPLQEATDISGLQILNPNFSRHLGPMTFDEASVVAAKIMAEGGHWRLPTLSEIVAISENSLWTREELFRLNTVWAAKISPAEIKKRDELVNEQFENKKKAGYMLSAYQLARNLMDEQRSRAISTRHAVNLITGNIIDSQHDGSIKYHSLFVRDVEVNVAPVSAANKRLKK